MKKRIFIVGFLVFLAMSIAGCQQASVPEGSGQKSPDDMIKDGMKKLAEIDAYSFNLSVKADLKGPEGEKPEKVSLNLQMQGASDMTVGKDPKLNLKISGDVSADQDGGNAEAELRINKDAVYANLLKLEAKGTVQVPGEVSQVAGKWWKMPIPPEALEELNKVLPQGNDSNLTEKQKKLKTAFENTKFFHEVKFIDMQNVNGEESHHYTAVLDKQALASFIVTAAELEGSKLTTSERNEMDSALKRFDVNADIYVGKSSAMVNKLSAKAKLIGTRVEPTGDITLEFSVSDVNKSVSVEVPSPTQEVPLQMLLAPFMLGIPGDTMMEPLPPAMDGSGDIAPTGTATPVDASTKTTGVSR